MFYTNNERACRLSMYWLVIIAVVGVLHTSVCYPLVVFIHILKTSHYVYTFRQRPIAFGCWPAGHPDGTLIIALTVSFRQIRLLLKRRCITHSMNAFVCGSSSWLTVDALNDSRHTGRQLPLASSCSFGLHCLGTSMTFFCSHQPRCPNECIRKHG